MTKKRLPEGQKRAQKTEDEHPDEPPKANGRFETPNIELGNLEVFLGNEKSEDTPPQNLKSRRNILDETSITR